MKMPSNAQFWAAWVAIIILIGLLIHKSTPITDVRSHVYPESFTVQVTDEVTGRTASVGCSIIDKGGSLQLKLSVIKDNFQMYDCERL